MKLNKLITMVALVLAVSTSVAMAAEGKLGKGDACPNQDRLTEFSRKTEFAKLDPREEQRKEQLEAQKNSSIAN